MGTYKLTKKQITPCSGFQQLKSFLVEDDVVFVIENEVVNEVEVGESSEEGEEANSQCSAPYKRLKTVSSCVKKLGSA